MADTETLERDGFQITKKVFTVPLNIASLDPATKRKVTICNLFANHRLSIRDVVRVLDEKYDHVVNVLIEQGLICERRTNPQRGEIERRRSLFKNP
jgi:hypothetical protein